MAVTGHRTRSGWLTSHNTAPSALPVDIGNHRITLR